MKRRKLVIVMISAIVLIFVTGIGVYQAKKSPKNITAEGEIGVEEKETLFVKSKPPENVKTAGAFLLRDINRLLYAAVEPRMLTNSTGESKKGVQENIKKPNKKQEREQRTEELPKPENKKEQSTEASSSNEQQSQSNSNEAKTNQKPAQQENKPTPTNENHEKQQENKRSTTSAGKITQPKEDNANVVDTDKKQQQSPEPSEEKEGNGTPEKEVEDEPVSEESSNKSEAETEIEEGEEE